MTQSTRVGAGNGIRTRDPQLGRLTLYQLSYSRPDWLAALGRHLLRPFAIVSSQQLHNAQWGGEDSNLRRPTPADLQSAPFGHSGNPPDLLKVILQASS